MLIRKLLLVIPFLSVSLQAGGVLDPLGWFKSQVDQGRSLYVSFGEDQENYLERLKAEKSELDQARAKIDDLLKAQLEKTHQQIALIKDRLREHTDEFLQRKLALLNELQQTLIDMQLARKQVALTLEQQIKLLEEYLKDPTFTSLSIDARSFYSFDNLQQISQKLADEQESIVHVEEQRNNILADLENQQHQQEQLERDLKVRDREFKEFLSNREGGTLFGPMAGMTSSQQAESLELHVRLLTQKVELIKQQILENKRKIGLLDTKLLVQRAKRKVLEDQRVSIKEGLRVAAADVEVQRADLEKKRRAHLEQKDQLYSERKTLEAEKEQRKAQFEKYAHELGVTISDIRDLDEMPLEPVTREGLLALSALVNLKEQIVRLDKMIEHVNAQIQLADAKFDREQTAVDMVESWHKLTMHRFRSEAEVEEEIYKYQEPLRAAEREIATLKEKSSLVSSYVNLQKRSLDSIKRRLDKISEHRNLFKGHEHDYLEALNRLRIAERYIEAQTSLNRTIIDTYSTIIQLRNNQKHHVQIILNELNGTGFRAPHAISWQGVTHVFSDLNNLKNEVWELGVAYIKQLPSSIAHKASSLGFIGFFWLFLKLLALFALYVFLRGLIPLLDRGLESVTRSVGTGLFLSGRALACIFFFIRLHFNLIFAWAFFYGLLRFDVIPDSFPRILFYFVSVGISLWLSSRFMSHFIAYNATHDELFVSSQTVERLFWVVRVLLYATCIIFFLREAIMLAYTKSELSIILLALYSIIARLVLISLIRKEDILELIPQKGPITTWLSTQVKEHFNTVFAFLVAIIILSEPHIGFGKYVSYFLWGTIGTILLVRGIFLLNEFSRRLASYVFFTSYEGEAPQERFPYAQSLYGVFAIVSFVFVLFLAILIGAKIWQYPLTLNDLYDLLNTKLGSYYSTTTEQHDVTPLSILQLLAFIVGSFVVASAANQFVLRYMFDLLIVDPGVQHAVSTFTYYLIVISVIMTGFVRFGLGYAVLVLLGSLAFGLFISAREYLNDFISYFILLVQRPFKIGDYVSLDDKLNGTVRKITPRSTIVRVKNSVTVIVPNSKIVAGNITNWSYSRSFIATPDIYVGVSYTADPAEVRTIIQRVLDAHINVLKNPRPVVRLEDFGEEGYNFLIRPYLSVDNVPHQHDIASDIRFALAKALKDRGIEIVSPAVIIKMGGS